MGNLVPGSKLHPKDFNLKDNLNSYSIGLEIINRGNLPYAPEQIKSVSNLIIGISEESKVDPYKILGHCIWTPERKTDPGPYW